MQVGDDQTISGDIVSVYEGKRLSLVTGAGLDEGDVRTVLGIALLVKEPLIHGRN